MSELKEIAKDLCEKSGCHHKCHDTDKCVVEDEALLLINQNKSNNFDVKSNEELFKQAINEGLTNKFDKILEESKKNEQIEELTTELIKTKSYGTLNSVALHLYNAGYRKQSEGHWITPTVIGGRAFNVPHCSVCEGIPCGVDKNTKFCPYCGARMKGE